MPYTQEELKNLSFYQNLIDEDEQHYLQRKALLTQQSLVSGSADSGNLVFRDKSGAVLLFENPYTDALVEDPSSKLILKEIGILFILNYWTRAIILFNLKISHHLNLL